MVHPRRTNRTMTRRILPTVIDMGPEIENVIANDGDTIVFTETAPSLFSRIRDRAWAIGFVTFMLAPWVGSYAVGLFV